MIQATYRFIVKVAHALFDEDSVDLARVMQRRAAEDTVDFILKEFPSDIAAFRDYNALLEFALSRRKIKGLNLEFGVYTGSSINFIASKVDETVYGFDSFMGLPEKWRVGYDQGWFKIKPPNVRKNVVLVQGWFKDTLPGFASKHRQKCAFIHIDSDLYSSAKTVLNSLDKQIVPGTVIVFNDFFNYPGWREGESKAFYEFARKHNLKYDYIAYLSRGGGVAIQIR